MDQEKIGRFIAELRKEHNMTQAQLAEKLGVTDRAISKWENGRGLPEVSSMKPLCKILDITLSELLDGERSEKSDIESTIGKNVLEALRDREREILKREHIQKVCSALMTIVIIFGSIFGLRVAYMFFSGLRGEGYSVGCFFDTLEAKYVSHLIMKGDYEKAVKHIGFKGENDKDAARENWVKNMQALYDEVWIEEIKISKIILDDYYPIGTYYMVVHDRKTQVNYLFDGLVTSQDWDTAFGGAYIPSTNTDIRRAQIAHMVEKALSTWYSG